jgi:flagellar secretion chaperone FliS
MFRSPFASSTPSLHPPKNLHPHAASAYRQVGAQTAVSAASPHQLVVLLFEGFFAAVNRAKGLRHRGDIAAMGQALGHAARIVDEGLKAGLNTKDGGRIASDLRDLYAYVTLRLTQANLHADEAAMDECLRLMGPLRDAWLSIGDKV